MHGPSEVTCTRDNRALMLYSCHNTKPVFNMLAFLSSRIVGMCSVDLCSKSTLSLVIFTGRESTGKLHSQGLGCFALIERHKKRIVEEEQMQCKRIGIIIVRKARRKVKTESGFFEYLCSSIVKAVECRLCRENDTSCLLSYSPGIKPGNCDVLYSGHKSFEEKIQSMFDDLDNAIRLPIGVL
jgi:hypothetical protein